MNKLLLALVFFVLFIVFLMVGYYRLVKALNFVPMANRQDCENIKPGNGMCHRWKDGKCYVGHIIRGECSLEVKGHMTVSSTLFVLSALSLVASVFFFLPLLIQR